MATQLNLHMTPEFERDLDRLRKLRGLRTKSEAIRVAVAEAVRGATVQPATRFSSWVGLASTGTPNPHPRFRDHTELWDDDRDR